MEEDMEIDHIVDVPDTPDRSYAGNKAKKCLGNPEKRERASTFPDEISNRSNYIILSPDKSYPSQKAPIFRRAQTEKYSGFGTSHSNGAGKIEKGKNLSSKIPSEPSHHGRISVYDLTEDNEQFKQPKPAFSNRGSRDNTIEDKKELKASIGNCSLPLINNSSNTSRNVVTGKCKLDNKTLPGPNILMDRGKSISVCSKIPSRSSHHERISVLDLTEKNGQFQQPKPAFSHRGSRENTIEGKKELKASIGNSPLPLITDSSNTSRNAVTGKCTLDNKTLQGPNIFMDRGKSISLSNDSQSQSKPEKQVSLPPCLSTTPKGRGHKRLVRHGVISPQNIATRAKQSAEQSSLQTNNVEQIHDGHSVSSNTMSPISVDDIVAEERGSGRVKGKGVLIHPSSHGTNTGTIHIDSSSPGINHEEASGTSNSARYSFENWETQGVWRNHSVGRFINRHNMNRLDRSYTATSQNGKDVPGSLSNHMSQSTSLIIPEVGQSTRPSPIADSLTKRQRKRESSSRNPNVASHNSETIFVNSSGESSSSSQSRVLDPESVELLSIPHFTNGPHEGLYDNNSSEARARQLEADERLARELQEQLYHDDYIDAGWIDEHLARELQDAGDLLDTSINNHHIPHPTRIPREIRQPRSRTQNPSNRRRTVPQVPLSNRTSQSRSRITNRASRPIIASRGRRPRFPLDMNLDMRLDILEALEDAVGDFNDMGMADDILNVHRDFNEDDYEMLLALDEHNDQHTGASANQINNLPQSTVQTDNFIEDCAVCLETPVKGEIIRHLPCLHKFHKDCIDPWLGRKRSCPVCKSSIT